MWLYAAERYGLEDHTEIVWIAIATERIIGCLEKLIPQLIWNLSGSAWPDGQRRGDTFDGGLEVLEGFADRHSNLAFALVFTGSRRLEFPIISKLFCGDWIEIHSRLAGDLM